MTSLPSLNGARWFKARASESAQGCFEVAHLDDGRVALRDSKDRSKAPQVYPADVWASWLDSLRAQRYTGHRIELAFTSDGVSVRDTADPTVPVHRYTSHEFTCFLSGVAAREFDLAS